ncbi:MAG: ribosome silencing factor [bacterium]|nr:ribosome silencing factor [bacterium]
MNDESKTDEDKQETVEFTLPDESDGWQLAERAAWHLLEKNAEDVVVLDLRGHSDVCDFFLLASGESDVQVRAAAKHLQDSLAAAGHKAKSCEGMNEGRWALLDYFDVVVHVFHVRSREYFQLERLWSEGGRQDLEPAWFADPQVAVRHPDLNFATAAGAGGTD